MQFANPVRPRPTPSGTWCHTVKSVAAQRVCPQRRKRTPSRCEISIRNPVPTPVLSPAFVGGRGDYRGDRGPDSTRYKAYLPVGKHQASRLPRDTVAPALAAPARTQMVDLRMQHPNTPLVAPAVGGRDASGEERKR